MLFYNLSNTIVFPPKVHINDPFHPGFLTISFVLLQGTCLAGLVTFNTSTTYKFFFSSFSLRPTSSTALMATALLGVVPSIISLIGAVSDGDYASGITHAIEIGTTVAPLLFLREISAGAQNSDGNVIGVSVGLFQGGAPDYFGGDPLLIHGYSEQGVYIGSGQFTGHMEEGKLYGVKLDDSGPAKGKEAYQLKIQHTGQKSVCVQWLEAHWNGKRVSGFDGNFAKEKNKPWYYSTEEHGKVDGKPYYPGCAWFDNHEKDVSDPVAEVSVNLPLFRKDLNPPSDVKQILDKGMKFSKTTSDKHQAPFHSSSSSQRRNRIAPAPGKRSSGVGAPYPKRDGTGSTPSGTSTGSASLTTGTGLPQSSGVLYSSDGHQSTRLVVSSHEVHSAKQLCDSETSRGPDFVSLGEDLYCEMNSKQKKVYPLCKGGDTSDCFDLKDTLNTAAKRIVRRGQNGGPNRYYDTVTHWGPHTENDGH